MYVLIWSVKWKSHNKVLAEAAHDVAWKYPWNMLFSRTQIVQRCNTYGCKNECGKMGISALCNDLHLLLSARNAECPAFHGLKRIMQRCNTYRHKIQNCLQRCKCRTNEKPL